MTDEPSHHRPGSASSHRHWYRLALGATILIVLVVLALLPVAVRSMEDVLGRGPDPLYDLVTGQEVAPATAAAAEADAAYVNLGVVDLDESTGQMTLAVSGNRVCAATCPALTLTFVSLDDDADQRRGLPPSATLKLSPDDRVFSESVQVPARGQPSLYPFDQYQLWPGVRPRCPVAPRSRSIPPRWRSGALSPPSRTACPIRSWPLL